MHFVIRGGKLVPTNPYYEDHYHALRETPYFEADEPKIGETAVLVAGNDPLVCGVPKDRITIESDILLFWAVNEDDGNKEVIVAFDALDVTNDPKDAWEIVPFGSWAQLRMNKDLVRAFESAEEARTHIHEDGLVFVPVNVVDGWRGVAVRSDPKRTGRTTFHAGGDPRMIKMLGIPKGWPINELFKQINYWMSFTMFTNDPFAELGKNVLIIEMLCNDDGIYILALIVDDNNPNLATYCGRQYSPAEAIAQINL